MTLINSFRQSVAFDNAAEKLDSTTAESHISASPPLAPAANIDPSGKDNQVEDL